MKNFSTYLRFVALTTIVTIASVWDTTLGAYYLAGSGWNGATWSAGSFQTMFQAGATTSWYRIVTGSGNTSIQFKVCPAQNWTTSYPSSNYNSSLSNGIKTIWFNSNGKDCSVEDTYCIVGTITGLSGSWTTDKDAMTPQGDNQYCYTFSNLAAGTYQFKVQSNGWTNSWGHGNYYSASSSGVTEQANGDNIQFTTTMSGEVKIYFNNLNNRVWIVAPSCNPPSITNVDDSYDINLDNQTTLSLNPTVTSGSTCTWSATGGSLSSNNTAATVFTPGSAGTYTLTLAATINGCQSTKTVTVNATKSFTVKVKNTIGWCTVNIYTFNPERHGEWPGTAMTNIGNGWWSADVAGSCNIIFNNGAGEQTSTENAYNDDVCLEIKTDKTYDTATCPSTDPSVSFSTVPSNWVTLGNSVSVTATSANGGANPQYQFRYKKDSNGYNSYSTQSSSSTFSFTPTTAGTYTIQVRLNGDNSYTATAQVIVKGAYVFGDWNNWGQNNNNTMTYDGNGLFHYELNRNNTDQYQFKITNGAWHSNESKATEYNTISNENNANQNVNITNCDNDNNVCVTPSNAGLNTIYFNSTNGKIWVVGCGTPNLTLSASDGTTCALPATGTQSVSKTITATNLSNIEASQLSWSVSPSSGASVSGDGTATATLTATQEGTYTITCSGTNDCNYSLSNKTITITVIKYYNTNNTAQDFYFYMPTYDSQWESSVYLRIGRPDHTSAEQMTKVTGTDRLWKVSKEYSNFTKFAFTNAAGETGNNMNVENNLFGITRRTVFHGENITQTMFGTRGSYGGEFNSVHWYDATFAQISSIDSKKYSVTLAGTDHGTIKIWYHDTSDAAQSFTTNSTVLPSQYISVEAIPADNYYMSAMTITPSEGSAETWTSKVVDGDNSTNSSYRYVVVNNITVTATFTKKSYKISFPASSAQCSGESGSWSIKDMTEVTAGELYQCSGNDVYFCPTSGVNVYAANEYSGSGYKPGYITADNILNPMGISEWTTNVRYVYDRTAGTLTVYPQGTYYRLKSTVPATYSPNKDLEGQVFYSNVVTNTTDYMSLFVAEGGTFELQAYTSGYNDWTTTTLTNPVASGKKGGVYIAKAESTTTITGLTAYTGNYYIRTDGATGGWNNYLSESDNQMTYLAPSDDYVDNFRYYWVQYLVNTQTKAAIANQYNPQLNIIEDLVKTGASNNGDGSVRFGYDPAKNLFTRTIINGSLNAQFLLVYGGENVYTNKDGTTAVSSSNTVKFSDLSNWVYQADIFATQNAKVILRAYFDNQLAGDEHKTATYWLMDPLQIDSEAMGTVLGTSTMSGAIHIRIIYDYKTNRLVTAWVANDEVFDGNITLQANMMVIREHNNELQSFTISNGVEVGGIKQIYTVFVYQRDNYGPAINKNVYWFSLPYRCKVGDVFGISGYGSKWGIKKYWGNVRAYYGWQQYSQTFWQTMSANDYLEPGEGYLLSFNLQYGDFKEVEEDDGEGNKSKTSKLQLFFPSVETSFTLNSTLPTFTYNGENATPALNWKCNIPGREAEDSYWHVIGIPGFDIIRMKTPTVTSFTGLDGNTIPPKFVYVWGGERNSYTVQDTYVNFDFMPTMAYMTQFAGTINWQNASSSTPVTSAPRRRTEAQQQQRHYDSFTLQLLQDGEVIDQTFVDLNDDGNFTIEPNEDLVKIVETNGEHVYTMQDNVRMAANTLPYADVELPLVVKLPVSGTYTLHLNGNGQNAAVTLFDKAEQRYINLQSEDYADIDIMAGESGDRFTLIFSTAGQHAGQTTGLDEAGHNSLVRTSENNIIIESQKPVAFVLYSAEGKLIDHGTASGTWRSAPLPQGVYMLRIGTRTTKVVL